MSRCPVEGPPASSISDRGTRQAQIDRQRQWHVADQRRGLGLNRGYQDRVALHRSWQAGAECLHRELQWPPARRVPE